MKKWVLLSLIILFHQFSHAFGTPSTWFRVDGSSLQCAMRTYTRGQKTVELVGVMAVGEKAYFDRVSSRFSNRAVIYSFIGGDHMLGVKEEILRLPDEERAIFNCVCEDTSWLIANAVGLSWMTLSMDYTKARSLYYGGVIYPSNPTDMPFGNGTSRWLERKVSNDTILYFFDDRDAPSLEATTLEAAGAIFAKRTAGISRQGLADDALSIRDAEAYLEAVGSRPQGAGELRGRYQALKAKLIEVLELENYIVVEASALELLQLEKEMLSLDFTSSGEEWHRVFQIKD
jgi:hypothetical protein